MTSLFRHARVSTKTSVWSGVSCSSSERETVATPGKHGPSPKSGGSEPSTPPSSKRRRGWRGSMQKIARQFTKKLHSKSQKDLADQSPGKIKAQQKRSSEYAVDKGPVKDAVNGMTKDQFKIAVTNDTMFQIAQGDVSKALRQAGYTVTGLAVNLVNAAVDAAWAPLGKVSSANHQAQAQLEAMKARDVEMKLAHLREISMLRDQIRIVQTDSLNAIHDMSHKSEIENVQLYEPLNYLDENSKTLVLEIVDEKLKELLTVDPDATLVTTEKLNHLAFNSFQHARQLQHIDKYKEDTTKLREEVKALQIDLSTQKADSSSILAKQQEESCATQEHLQNDLATVKQELKSERSRATGLSKELDKVKLQHQASLWRQNQFAASVQESFSQGRMETSEMETSHVKLKSELNQLFSDHLDLKHELQQSKRSEEEKVTQVKQLEKQALKEAARIRQLQDLFQMALPDATGGRQLEDQFHKVVVDAAAQVDQVDAAAQVDYDSSPEMLDANIEELRNALELAESRYRQVGLEKRQLEAVLREEKMSLLLNRAVNESLHSSGLSLLRKASNDLGDAGADDENMIFETKDAHQHHYQAGDEVDGAAPNPETQSTTTASTCDTDLGLEADDVKMGSQVRMPPEQRMGLFAITHEDLVRICKELDGSDERTSELEAAAAEAMASIRRYQSHEMQIEAQSENPEPSQEAEEEHAKVLQEQMEQLQKALMHEVSHRRSLQEQYQIQEKKLTNSLLQMASQTPIESRVQSPSPSPSDSSMAAIPPSSLQEARRVQALIEKLQRKEDVIKMKQAQIKMLLADSDRMRAASSRTRAEVARLRAKLRMCVCMRGHTSAGAMGKHLDDSDEASASGLPSPTNNEQLYFNSGIRPVTCDIVVDGVGPGGAFYNHMHADDGQEPGSLLIASPAHSVASSRRKPSLTHSLVGKPNKEEFNAGIVGTKVRKQSTEAVLDKKLLSADPNPLESNPTVHESMTVGWRSSAPHKLSVPKAGPVATRRRSVPASQRTVPLSDVLCVLPISDVRLPSRAHEHSTPGVLNLAKSRPASDRPVVKK